MAITALPVFLTDLFDANVEVTLDGDTSPVVLRSPFQSDRGATYSLKSLIDNAVVCTAPSIPGRLNIMAAPEALVRGLPTEDTATADAILRWRESRRAAEKPPTHVAELFLDGFLTIEQLARIAPFVNVGGCVFRAQVIGSLESVDRCLVADVVIYRGRHSTRVLHCRFHPPRLRSDHVQPRNENGANL